MTYFSALKKKTICSHTHVCMIMHGQGTCEFWLHLPPTSKYLATFLPWLQWSAQDDKTGCEWSCIFLFMSSILLNAGANQANAIAPMAFCQAANFKNSFSSSANADCFWYLSRAFRSRLRGYTIICVKLRFPKGRFRRGISFPCSYISSSKHPNRLDMIDLII